MHFLLPCVRFLKSEMAPGGVPETISKIPQKTFTLNCYGSLTNILTKVKPHL